VVGWYLRGHGEVGPLPSYSSVGIAVTLR